MQKLTCFHSGVSMTASVIPSQRWLRANTSAVAMALDTDPLVLRIFLLKVLEILPDTNLLK